MEGSGWLIGLMPNWERRLTLPPILGSGTDRTLLELLVSRDDDDEPERNERGDCHVYLLEKTSWSSDEKQTIISRVCGVVFHQLSTEYVKEDHGYLSFSFNRRHYFPWVSSQTTSDASCLRMVKMNRSSSDRSFPTLIENEDHLRFNARIHQTHHFTANEHPLDPRDWLTITHWHVEPLLERC